VLKGDVKRQLPSGLTYSYTTNLAECMTCAEVDLLQVLLITYIAFARVDG